MGRRWYVLGLGRVGAAMATVLKQRGVLGGGWTRRAERRDALEARLGIAVDARALPAEAIRACDVVLVALPDAIWPKLLAALDPVITSDPARIWIHVSGAQGADALRATGVAGPVGSAHPLHAFVGAVADVDAMRGAYFATDGDPEALAAATWLAEAAGGDPHRVPGQARAAYHLAAVLASNGTYALAEAADEVARCHGIDAPSLNAGLARLMVGSAEMIAAHGVTDAATGPIVRGDAETIRGHRRALMRGGQGLEQLYRELNTTLLRIAERRGLSTTQLGALEVAIHGVLEES